MTDTLRADLERAQALYKARQWQDAEALCKAMLARAPAHFPALRLLALGSSEQRRPRAALAYARRALRLRPAAVMMIETEARSLEELGRKAEAEAAWGRAIEKKPDDPRLMFRRAHLFADLRRNAEALALYDRILAIVPDNFAAELNRGNALRALRRIDDAIESFKRAIALKPDYALAHNNLGNALQALGNYEEAIGCYERAIVADPSYIEAVNNLGNALQALGRYEAAIAAYDRVLERKPEFSATLWNKGTTMLHLGLSREAWQLYEHRLKSDQFDRLPGLNLPLLGARPVDGQKLLVQWEARFGDVIQMLRYLPALQARAAQCWLQVAPPLRALVARSFPAARIVTSGDSGEAEYRIPYTSLPLAMETFSESAIPSSMPYLAADPGMAAQWLQGVARPRVGLAWRGNPVPAHRSASLEILKPLLALRLPGPGLQWVSLQKGLKPEEREQLAAAGNVLILDDELASFDETAAVVANLDLVISVDSAVAHLAGALGCPAWIMLKLGADWRWLSARGDTPWYPTLRLFRQQTLGDWHPVVEALCTALPRWLSDLESASP